jgi:hypothetical protein
VIIISIYTIVTNIQISNLCFCINTSCIERGRPTSHHVPWNVLCARVEGQSKVKYDLAFYDQSILLLTVYIAFTSHSTNTMTVNPILKLFHSESICNALSYITLLHTNSRSNTISVCPHTVNLPLWSVRACGIHAKCTQNVLLWTLWQATFYNGYDL